MTNMLLAASRRRGQRCANERDLDDDEATPSVNLTEARVRFKLL